MTPVELARLYRAYIDCLNLKDWARLGDFVDEAAVHNGRPLGLTGYRAMLEQGVWLPCSQFEAAFLSTAHTTENVQQTVEAARNAFAAS